MLRQDDWGKAQLVTAGWLWGKAYGGHLAATLIMDVLMNRVRAGWGPIANIIDNIPEKAYTLTIPTGIPEVWSPNFIRLLHEVENSWSGAKDSSKGSLYWADTVEISNPWFKERIIDYPEIHPCVCDMNSLIVLI